MTYDVFGGTLNRTQL